MKKSTRYSIFVVLLFLIPALWAIQITSHSETLDIGPGQMVRVMLTGGDIQVTTWDRNSLLLNVVGTREFEPSHLQIDQSGEEIQVRLRNAQRLEMRVSTQSSLYLTTGGGNIQIQGPINGSVTAKSGGGNLNLGEVTGTVELSTGGGDLRIGSVNGDATARTGGGNITFESVSGNGEIKTAGGNIEGDSVGQNLEAKTAGGNISVQRVGGVATVVTAGGNIRVGEVARDASLKTAGGNIELQSGSGQVSATTRGGNVDFRQVMGSVEIKTAGGNVSAGLIPVEGGSSSIQSAGGDLTLFISPSAQAEIQARIRRGGPGRPEENDIHSDFPMSEYQKGESNGPITGKVILNGGGHAVSLTTADGSILIRRLE